jgi:flagellar biosynthetic protein FliP
VRRTGRLGTFAFLVVLLGILTLLGTLPASAQQAATPIAPGLSINIGGTEQGNVSSAIQIVLLMTVLTLAPSILLLMTCFTRIVIVLGFVRSALGVQGAPSNQLIIGMALFLTFFIMAPVGQRMNDEALQPYLAKSITSAEAYEKASVPLRQFLLRQTRPAEVDFFLGLSGRGPTKIEELPLNVVAPAFIVSELQTAFQMGFLIFVPFLVIDFLVASTLMSMGMMMMPPVMISLPFKLLLFVLVDGWHLVVRSLVESFGV